MFTSTVTLKLIIIEYILFVHTFVHASGNQGRFTRSSTLKSYNVPDLIRYDGYPVEIHKIITEDGYILELHRIPRGRNETDSRKGNPEHKPVALMAHCFMCSSAAYVVLGPNGGLAYMLANANYDVWMVNARGTKYSRNHTTLSPTSRKFWQFSWHEIGVFDISASVDYVLKKTGETKLDAIGYSMGTVQFLCLLSEKPEYNEKIKALTLLAPAAFLGRSRSPIVSLPQSLIQLIVDFGATTGQLEVAGENSGLKELLSSLCQPNIFLEAFCDTVLMFAGGSKNSNVNRKAASFFFRFFPEATSLRTLIHFEQNYRTGRFQKYNYGRRRNGRVYGSTAPSEYDLSRVLVPVNLLWSLGDTTTVYQDVEKLVSALPNVKSTYVVPDKSFSHADFIWGKHAHLLVYNQVLKVLRN